MTTVFDGIQSTRVAIGFVRCIVKGGFRVSHCGVRSSMNNHKRSVARTEAFLTVQSRQRIHRRAGTLSKSNIVCTSIDSVRLVDNSVGSWMTDNSVA